MGDLAERKVLWGLDPGEVKTTLAAISAERDKALARAEAAEANYTELRLQSAKQVEEASAEAAVVLGHARSEATRIREAAVHEAEKLRHETRTSITQMMNDAEESIAGRLVEVEDQERKAQATVEASQKRADEIIRFANSQAEKLRSEAYEVLRSAEEQSQKKENENRLKRLEAERAEAELVDQANRYSKRVHQEADRHWQSTQKRSNELRLEAEDLLRQSQGRALEITRDAANTARRLLEETLERMALMSSEVGASMSVVSRARRSLGDQLERLDITETRLVNQEAASIEPTHVKLDPSPPQPEESETGDTADSASENKRLEATNTAAVNNSEDDSQPVTENQGGAPETAQ